MQFFFIATPNWRCKTELNYEQKCNKFQRDKWIICQVQRDCNGTIISRDCEWLQAADYSIQLCNKRRRQRTDAMGQPPARPANKQVCTAFSSSTNEISQPGQLHAASGNTHKLLFIIIIVFLLTISLHMRVYYLLFVICMDVERRRLRYAFTNIPYVGMLRL